MYLIFTYRCEGYCTFENCKYKFKVIIPPHAYESAHTPSMLQLHVTSEGEIFHDAGQRKSRYFRGGERMNLQNLLKCNSPTTILSKQYLSLSQEKLLSGNRDGVGKTLSVFQRISSEGVKSQQADPDVVTSLLKLRDEILKKKLDRIGYVQRVHAFPFSVHCYTEMGIRIFHYIGKQQAIFCDATGTIVSLRKQSHNTSGLLYYSIVLQHPCVKESPRNIDS